MKIKTSLLIAIFALTAALCALLMLWPRPEGRTAVIYQDGREIQRVSLDALAERKVIELGGNTICIERDGVYMLYSSCPDKSCVKQGKITKAGTAIVCLPNRVVVRLLPDENTPDAVLR